jgi:hypothetical protein
VLLKFGVAESHAPCVAERSAQAQPPEADVACNDDVRVSIVGQLPGAAAVACSGWFGDLGVTLPSYAERRTMRNAPSDTLYQTGNQILKRSNVAGLDKHAEIACALILGNGVTCRLSQVRLQFLQGEDEKVPTHRAWCRRHWNANWPVGFGDARVTQSPLNLIISNL